jgi:hypothetical protein
METSAAIKSFFLVMTMHPEIVRLAQKELDGVLGGERLPDFSDKPRLPYISAIMKEVLRWGHPTPLGTVLLLSFYMSVVLDLVVRDTSSVDGGRRLRRMVHPRRYDDL